MLSLTLAQVKALKHGTIVYDKNFNNADGTPKRWRVNGKVRTWKRSPDRVEVPIKCGLYQFHYITEHNYTQYSLSSGDAAETE